MINPLIVCAAPAGLLVAGTAHSQEAPPPSDQANGSKMSSIGLLLSSVSVGGPHSTNSESATASGGSATHTSLPMTII